MEDKNKMVFDEFAWADDQNDERRCEHMHKDAPENAVCEDCVNYPTKEDIVGCDKCGLGLI